MTRRNILRTAGVCSAVALIGGGGLLAARSGASGQAPQGAELASWAAGRFLAHWNCTQAVLEAFAPAYGADVAMACKIATAFAGGMCQGELCGSFTGAYMVIGLAHGAPGAPGRAVTGRVAEFTASMKERFGALSCSALLGFDMGTAEGVKLAGEKGLFKTFCPKLVEESVRRLQVLL